VPLDRPIEAYASVVAWRDGLCKQWGGDPLGEEPDKLATLGRFCDLVDRDPDALVDFCFLRRKQTGERFGSVKRREQLADELRRFRSESGLSGTAARKLVNDVLSFLIHNGVLINPGMI
jgi:hypothetical protein